MSYVDLLEVLYPSGPLQEHPFSALRVTDLL